MQNEDGFVEEESLDQDGFVADEVESAAAPISQLASGLAGAEQGLLLSFPDEAGAAYGALKEYLPGTGESPRDAVDTARTFLKNPAAQAEFDKITPKPSLSELYNEYLEFNRQKYKTAEEANPNSYLAGQFTGGALTPMGPLGASSKGAVAAGKGAARVAMAGGASKEAALLAAKSALRTNALKQGAKTGAMIGGINSAGMSEAPIMSGEFAQDIGTGVAGGSVLGATLPAAIHKVSDVSNKVGPEISSATRALAEKIFGPIGDSYQMGKDVGQVVSKQGEARGRAHLAEGAENIAGSFKSDINRLATIKKAIQEEAEARGITLDEDAVNKILSQIENHQLKSQLPNAASDLQKLQTLVSDYKNGKPVKKLVREEMPSQIEKFRHVEELKKAEQLAIASGVDPADIETVFEQVDVPGKIAAVVRQVLKDKEGAPTGKFKKLASRMVDESDIPSSKSSTQTVFEGAQDLTQPAVAAQFQDDVGNLTKFGDNSIKTPEVQRLATETTTGIRDAQRAVMPTQEVDKAITAYNRAGELLGLDLRNLTGPVAEAKARDRILSLLKQESGQGVGKTKASARVEDAISQIESVNPAFARNLRDDIDKFSARTGALEQIVAPAGVLGINPLAWTRSFGAAGANLAGASAGSLEKTGQKVMSSAKAKGSALVNLSKAHTPEWMQQKASQLASHASPAAKELGQILGTMATKEERARNAMMVMLMQNPAYRNLMSDENEEGIPK